MNVVINAPVNGPDLNYDTKAAPIEVIRQIHDAMALSSYPQNKTGIWPTEFKLLVKPKAAEEISKGGIIIPKSTQDTEKFAQTEGVVVAVSPLAFTYATKDEWEAAGARPPKPGQTVLYAKYAGNWVKGKDGGEYLLINDKDVCATIEE